MIDELIDGFMLILIKLLFMGGKLFGDLMKKVMGTAVLLGFLFADLAQ